MMNLKRAFFINSKYHKSYLCDQRFQRLIMNPGRNHHHQRHYFNRRPDLPVLRRNKSSPSFKNKYILYSLPLPLHPFIAKLFIFGNILFFFFPLPLHRHLPSKYYYCSFLSSPLSSFSQHIESSVEASLYLYIWLGCD